MKSLQMDSVGLEGDGLEIKCRLEVTGLDQERIALLVVRNGQFPGSNFQLAQEGATRLHHGLTIGPREPGKQLLDGASQHRDLVFLKPERHRATRLGDVNPKGPLPRLSE